MTVASTVVLAISAVSFAVASIGFWYTMNLVHERTKPHPKSSK